MILIDADVAIDILRQYPPAMAWAESVSMESVVLPGFVLMELFQGCRNKEQQDKIERTLFRSVVLWPAPDACDAALSLYKDSHLSHGLGMLDALIGQLAVSLDIPLHTFNERHFFMIPGIRIVKPYERTL